MPKGYWVGHLTITDQDGYMKYREANAAPFAEYGAKFLVRGAPQNVVEGEQRPRTVVIEFPSLQAALDCYHSETYQAAKALRDPAGVSDLVIVEGYSE